MFTSLADVAVCQLPLLRASSVDSPRALSRRILLLILSDINLHRYFKFLKINAATDTRQTSMFLLCCHLKLSFREMKINCGSGFEKRKENGVFILEN